MSPSNFSSSDVPPSDSPVSPESAPKSLSVSGETADGKHLSLPTAQKDEQESFREQNHRKNEPDAYTQVMMRLVDLLAHDTLQSGANEPQKTKINPENIIGMLHRRLIPMTFMFVIGLFCVAWLIRPDKPVYLATTTVLLPKSSLNDVLIQLSGAPNAENNARSSTETQIAIMTSPEVISRSLARLKPELRQRGWGSLDVNQAEVSASSTVSDDLIDVAVVSLDPESSRTLANTVADVYTVRMRELDSQSQEANLQFIGQKVKEVQNELLEAKQKLRAFREKSGVFDVTSQLSSNSSRLQELQQKAQSAQLEAQAGSFGTALVSDAVLTELQRKSDEAQERYRTLLRDFYPTADRVQRALQDAKSAQAAVKQRASLLSAGARKRAMDAQTELAQARKQASKLPSAEFQLGQLNSRVELLENTYKAVSDRYTSLNLSRNARTQTPTILRPAVVQNISGTFGRRALVMSALCALVLAGLLGLLLEQVDKTIHSATDLQAFTQTPVMAVLPLLSDYSERRLTHITHEKADVHMLKACYAMQTNVISALSTSPARSILITSSATGEGKSLCALNMAASLALGSWRVLLIDCDFWQPAQHYLNEIPLTPGYSDVLSGRQNVEEALHKTSINNLWVMPAGKLSSTPDASALLNSQANHELLESLKNRFDLVIIDSPPAFSLSSAQILTSLADGIMMVVSASTPQAQIQQAQSSLLLTGGHLLGLIFNKSTNKQTLQPTTLSTSLSHSNNKNTPFADYEKLLQESVEALSNENQK